MSTRKALEEILAKLEVKRLICEKKEISSAERGASSGDRAVVRMCVEEALMARAAMLAYQDSKTVVSEALSREGES